VAGGAVVLRGGAGALGAVVFEDAFFLSFLGDGSRSAPAAERFLEMDGDGVVDGDVGCLELC